MPGTVDVGESGPLAEGGDGAGEVVDDEAAACASLVVLLPVPQLPSSAAALRAASTAAGREPGRRGVSMRL
ncbi:MAG: hypothetical protein ACR2KL_02155 [Nocardioidaceae bacterium]